MKVTFDSNIWRPLVSPQKFSSEASKPEYIKIRSAIQAGEIIPFLSETTFTLEAIKRRDRRNFFGNYSAKIDVTPAPAKPGFIGMRFTIKPDENAHPGNVPILADHFTDAFTLGFRLLRSPRVGGIINKDVQHARYTACSEVELKDAIEKCAEVLDMVEAYGCGMSHIKEIGLRYTTSEENWKEGLLVAPESEEKAIQNAIAEWADGDAIAAHIAYDNDYFCTADIARGAGSKSIFSTENRLWLKQKYAIKIVSLIDLAAIF